MHWLVKGLGPLGSHRTETLGGIHRASVLNKHGGSGVEQEGFTRLPSQPCPSGAPHQPSVKKRRLLTLILPFSTFVVRTPLFN